MVDSKENYKFDLGVKRLVSTSGEKCNYLLLKLKKNRAKVRFTSDSKFFLFLIDLRWLMPIRPPLTK